MSGLDAVVANNNPQPPTAPTPSAPPPVIAPSDAPTATATAATAAPAYTAPAASAPAPAPAKRKRRRTASVIGISTKRRSGANRSAAGASSAAAAAAADDGSMEVCLACGLTGELLCCDACPLAYHFGCLGFDESNRHTLPDPWNCPICQHTRSHEHFRQTRMRVAHERRSMQQRTAAASTTATATAAAAPVPTAAAGTATAAAAATSTAAAPPAPPSARARPPAVSAAELALAAAIVTGVHRSRGGRRAAADATATDVDTSVDLCLSCGRAGSLLVCDFGCGCAWHIACIGLERVPTGAWQCAICCKLATHDYFRALRSQFRRDTRHSRGGTSVAAVAAVAALYPKGNATSDGTAAAAASALPTSNRAPATTDSTAAPLQRRLTRSQVSTATANTSADGPKTANSLPSRDGDSDSDHTGHSSQDESESDPDFDDSDGDESDTSGSGSDSGDRSYDERDDASERRRQRRRRRRRRGPRNETRRIAQRLYHSETALFEIRHCAFCRREEEMEADGVLSDEADDLIGPFFDETVDGGEEIWVHRECAVWAPNIYVDASTGEWQNVCSELNRARALNCADCRKGGASIGCLVESCPRVYHVPCAKRSHCYMREKLYTLHCPDHVVEYSLQKQFHIDPETALIAMPASTTPAAANSASNKLARKLSRTLSAAAALPASTATSAAAPAAAPSDSTTADSAAAAAVPPANSADPAIVASAAATAAEAEAQAKAEEAAEAESNRKLKAELLAQRPYVNAADQWTARLAAMIAIPQRSQQPDPAPSNDDGDGDGASMQRNRPRGNRHSRRRTGISAAESERANAALTGFFVDDDKPLSPLIGPLPTTDTSSTAGGGSRARTQLTTEERQQFKRNHRIHPLNSNSVSFRASLAMAIIAKNTAKAAASPSTPASASGDQLDVKHSIAPVRRTRSRSKPPAASAADSESSPALSSVEGSSVTSALPPVLPAPIDPAAVWGSIGGLQTHVQSLKECVLLPLLYPELFARLHIEPPRGLLLYGPPGTGKTLLARALCNICLDADAARPKITFFARKGADLLSKFHGESEAQLRVLFEKARAAAPAIIFFDEIDGLTPTRNSKQSQVHSSIVTTLLSCMDGLDKRGDVFVIGATNRLDSVDPALRRGGRFDRELYVPLPNQSARRDILSIHTRAWLPAPPPNEWLTAIADRAIGFSGADLRALCVETALLATRRALPNLSAATQRKESVLKSIRGIRVQLTDFELALQRVVPTSLRVSPFQGRPLTSKEAPLLSVSLQRAIDALVPPTAAATGAGSAVEPPRRIATSQLISSNRVLIAGERAELGQLPVALALLNSDALDGCSLFSLDLPTLYSSGGAANKPEEVCVRTFQNARACPLSVVFIPAIDEWWIKASALLRTALVSCLRELQTSIPPPPLATATLPSSAFAITGSGNSNHRLIVVATSNRLWTSANAFAMELHPSVRSFFAHFSVDMTEGKPSPLNVAAATAAMSD